MRLGHVLQDLRFGVRTLRRSPGFTAVAILALALGVGANTAIFSVVNGLVLRPLPFPRPDRLVQVMEHAPGNVIERPAVAYPNFLDWREQATVFEAIGVIRSRSMNLGGPGEPERVGGLRASGSIFRVLGVTPAAGRFFDEAEDVPGGGAVAVISHGLWMRRFAGDPGVIGRSIPINDVPTTILGVLPARLEFLDAFAVWVPLAVEPARLDRGNHFLTAFARVKPGVTLGEAQAEMSTIAARLAAKFPDTNRGNGVLVMPLQTALTETARPALFVLLGAVGFVLLIACANVANLMLARATVRRREIAIRASLGAGRTRIAAQLLTESAILALLGGAAGLLLGIWGLDALTAILPGNMAAPGLIRIDGRVLTFTLGITALTAVLFGTAPALLSSRRGFLDGLREGGRGAAPGRSRLRSGMVVAEVALAILLLVGAGLLMRSFSRLTAIDPGIRVDGVLTLRVALSEKGYPDDARLADVTRAAAERLAALPGVEAAGATLALPLESPDGWDWGFRIEGRAAPAEGQSHGTANYLPVSPGAFQALGIDLVRGRLFDDTDRAGSLPVAILGETAARQLWPDGDPIGARLLLGGHEPLTVVGVVSDVRWRGLDRSHRQDLYVPLAQRPQRAFGIVVRTAGDPAALGESVRRALAEVAPGQPVYGLRTMAETLGLSVGQPLFALRLLAAFAALALVLAGVGIYGVMAYSVTQRTQEIGLRMALGAKGADVLRMVLGQGATLAGAGVAIGLAAALALTRAMTSLLFGVSPSDPITYAGVAALLAGAALAATWLPARRAMKVDPMEALRAE